MTKEAQEGRYSLGDLCLLLFWSITPIMWWFVSERIPDFSADSRPNAYLLCSVLMTFSLSYGLSVRLNPGLGWMSESRVER